jgi:hypothetical protein
MQCAHLPMSFSDVSRTFALNIAKAARDLPGPVFIYSNEGHRAYAAAAIAEVTLGEMNSDEAVAALKKAGMPTTLPKLFAAVKSAVPAETRVLDSMQIEFSSQASISPAVDTMCAIDRMLSRVNSGTKSADADESARKTLSRDAHNLLQKLMHYNADESQSRSAEFRAQSHEAVVAAALLACSASEWSSTPDKKQAEELLKAADRVTRSCNSCHSKFRDGK